MEIATNNVKKRILENAKLVEAALAEYYTEEDEDLALLLDAEKYSLFAGGKRIRPFLVLEFCRMFGGKDEAALPLACAIEMIHTSSLIHDDLPCMDDDDLRRGKPTNHKVFGYANALLAGDALLMKAFEVLSMANVSDAAVRAAVAALSCASGDFGMVGGQIMDINEDPKVKFPLEKLKKLQRKKTGALIRCSALLGCIAAGLEWDSEKAQDACEYAEKIGLAFQIVDDILDVTGDESKLGKDIGSDAEMGKTTFMSYYTPDEAKNLAELLTAEAVGAISEYEDSEILTDLAVFLLERDH